MSGSGPGSALLAHDLEPVGQRQLGRGDREAAQPREHRHLTADRSGRGLQRGERRLQALGSELEVAAFAEGVLHQRQQSLAQPSAGSGLARLDAVVEQVAVEPVEVRQRDLRRAVGRQPLEALGALAQELADERPVAVQRRPARTRAPAPALELERNLGAVGQLRLEVARRPPRGGR